MLFKTLLKLKERKGLTDDLKNKIDVFFAVGRITEEQYNELMDVAVKDIYSLEIWYLSELLHLNRMKTWKENEYEWWIS